MVLTSTGTFYIYVLLIVVCPFVLFLLVIVLSVLLRYTDSDYTFGIFKLLFLPSLSVTTKIVRLVLTQFDLYPVQLYMMKFSRYIRKSCAFLSGSSVSLTNKNDHHSGIVIVLGTATIIYNPNHYPSPEFTSGIFVGFELLIFVVFCVVILCVFTFRVLCCDVRYDFRIKTMFGSSLPPIVCMRNHVLFTLFVLVWV
jgi:hypothetical protein